MKVKSLVSHYLASKLTSYRDDEEGALTAFAIVMFLMMVVGAGMATDFMRHETYRAELQNALDRGLLAASALSQTVDPTVTVEEYVLKSVNHTAGTPTVNVSAPSAEYTADKRKVVASASYEFNTSFLRIIGIPTLQVIARGVAEQERQRVEVSFVVDISPSMNDNSKLTTLKRDAKLFVSALLNDSTKDYTSISLVPYGGQVGLPPELFAKFNTTVRHNYSRCLNFPDGDYNTLNLNPADFREHMMHFNYGSAAWYLPAVIDWGWCPTGNSEVVAFSNVVGDLHTAIDGLGMHEATGIQFGLKWGLGLLDPGMRTAITDLSATPLIDSAFANRPGEYNDHETVKYVVLMTDGAITRQQRLSADRYDYDSSSSPADCFDADNNGSCDYDQSAIDYYGVQDNYAGSHTFMSTSEADARAQLMSLCNQARATVVDTRGDTRTKVRVFTIGFDLPALDPTFDPLVDTPSDAAEVMYACASTPADAYLVGTPGLAGAFEQIAQTIKALKLSN